MIMIIFSVVVVFLNQRSSEISNERFYDALIDTAYILESEITFAIISENGFQRTFDMPRNILSLNYSISYANGDLLNQNYSIFFINYTEERYSHLDYFFFTHPNITGNIFIDQSNVICKRNDEIILNDC